MAARAIEERAALNRLFAILLQRYEEELAKPHAILSKVIYPEILHNKLTITEWKVVECMQQVLNPIKISSKQLQGNGVSGPRSTSGGFDEYFPVIETLLDHLERCGKGDCLVGVDDGQELKNFKLFDGLDPPNVHHCVTSHPAWRANMQILCLKSNLDSARTNAIA
jgi:hypothetical protein